MPDRQASRVKHLSDLISKCNDYYWLKQDCLLSDYEYDKLVEELRSLDPNNELLSHVGHGAITSKLRHLEHMYSLDKCYSWDAMIDWCKSVARSDKEIFCLSPKLDGCSMEFTGDRLVTRGDGEFGNDVTHLAAWIKCVRSWRSTPTGTMAAVILGNVKYQLGSLTKHKSDGETVGRMVGELIVPLNKFDEIKNTYPCFAEYKTPRNMAAAFISLPADSTILKQLVYHDAPVPVCTWVRHRAYEISMPLTKLCNAESTIITKLKNYRNCPCDGIVCRLADDTYAESLGFTKHHPKGSMALKFCDDPYETTVISIDWSVGNDAITPVANVEPVNIDGVIVSRATCHNAAFVKSKNIAPGCSVTVVRRGGVIPKIVYVAPIEDDTQDAVIPDKCPVCEEPTSMTSTGVDLICTNPQCKGRIVNRIGNGLHLLGVKGIGPALLERIVSEFYIQNIMEYFLETWDEDLMLKKDFTAHEIHVIQSEFDRIFVKGMDDATVFASLCIPMASTSFAEKVIKYTGSIMSLMDTPDAIRSKLDGLVGINTTAIANVIKFLTTDDNAAKFQTYYAMFEHNRPTNEDSLPKYCFTGALPLPRKDMEAWVLKHGGYPTDNVHKANYLVSASPTSTSEKMKYAKTHNIPVITYEELKQQLSK